MDVKFRQVTEFPENPEPGTHYYIDNLDGTAAMLVTDADGTPRQVVGLMTSGSLTRAGVLQSGAVKTGTTFFQKFTPTRDIRFTQVTIQGLSVLSGTARIRISPNNGSGTTELAGANATPTNGGVTAPISYTLTAGTPYIIGVYGASLSLTLSSGHTWDGLTQPDTALITSTPTSGGWTQEAATGAQMAFLFDVGGQVVRRVEAGAGLTSSVTDGTLHLDVAPIDLAATGTGDVSELLPTVQAQMTGDGEQYLGSITANEAGEVTALSLYASNNAHPALTVTLSVRVPGAGYGAGTGALVTQSPAVPLGGLTWVQFPLAAPLRFTPGQRLEVYYADNDPDLGVGAELGRHTSTGPVPTTDGRYTLVFTDQNPSPMAMRLHGPAGVLRGELPLGRVQNLQATLDAKASGADLAALTARVTAVEARPTWDAEAIQDLVGAMLPQGTYDDAGGTVSFTFATPRTNEEIQDVVAALIQAGANVTKTYDDAGNVLTISATGGSSGPTTRSVTGTTPTLAAGASANLDLVNATPALIRKLVTSAAARVGLYASAADRTADAARLDGSPTAAPTSAYPITQATTTAAGTVAIGEAAQGALYARVVNLSGAAAALTLTLTLEDA